MTPRVISDDGPQVVAEDIKEFLRRASLPEGQREPAFTIGGRECLFSEQLDLATV
jgi:hypothetical protein